MILKNPVNSKNLFKENKMIRFGNIVWVFVVSLAVSGCAISPEKAATMSSYDLCSSAMAPLATSSLRESAYRALAVRGEDCSAYMEIISARQAQNMQMLGLGVQMMQPVQVAPIPTQPSTCITRPSPGGSLTTNCY